MTVDLILHNAKVYTADSAFTVVEAFAVKDGRIIAVGTTEAILDIYSADSTFDLKGQPVIPGLIDAHSHFLGYAKTKLGVDLVGTKMFDEVLQRVADHRQKFPDDPWIQGRGWDQNDWDMKEFPDRAKLDSLFPQVPIILKRIDGHAALANQRALDLAGITPGTTVGGGMIEVKDGRLTGILMDNAVDLVTNVIPDPDAASLTRVTREAEQDCFAVGLTGVCDAGLKLHDILFLDSLQRAGALSMRIFAMHDPKPPNIEYVRKNGILKTDQLNVRAFKMYADGALGSRGAWLLEPYADDPGNRGLNTFNADTFHLLANLCLEKNLQMCVHAIGDAANKMVLDSFSAHLATRNDRRWRIEHCQVIDPIAPNRFYIMNVIPSVQPTHATSDMYWAQDRLGDRIPHAYAYRDLLERQHGIRIRDLAAMSSPKYARRDFSQAVALGSDFPVESINPLFGFFAAVARRDQSGYPEDGWQMENALTREDALKGMTIWAAFAQFEENERGSLEVGKLADFVVLDRDIMTCPEMEIFRTQVLMTYLGGKRVF